MPLAMKDQPRSLKSKLKDALYLLYSLFIVIGGLLTVGAVIYFMLTSDLGAFDEDDNYFLPAPYR